MNYKKVNKIMFVETLSNYYYPYQNWYLPLKKLCKSITNFDCRRINLKQGKEIMNKRFLDTIKKEKPDFIFMWLRYDEFYIDTLLKVRKISPKTIIINFFGDDDVQFDSFSRYWALFFDYCLIAQYKYLEKYRQDGISNIFFTTGINIDNFKPIKINKRYDVSFIGAPKTSKAGRYHLVKYLIDNKINLALFGNGWGNYREFKNIYYGPLNNAEMTKVINQTRINLAFSKNNYGEMQLKGRYFEISACKSFALLEYFKDYYKFFSKDEIVMFKDKEDLLNKIRYYLKNEEEREKIAERSYKRVIKDYNITDELKNFFKFVEKNSKNFKHKDLPKLNKKIISLSEKEMILDKDKLEEKLKNYDYIVFKKNRRFNLKYRKYLQAYSLLKSGKDISCCDYYVYSKKLGNYLTFNTKDAFNMMLERRNFDKLIDIAQVMTTKKYFLSNIERFRNLFYKREGDLIDDKNTVFVSIPLVSIEMDIGKNFEVGKNYFFMNYLYKIYSSILNKKIGYIFSVLYEAIKGNFFLLKEVVRAIFDKDKWSKLKRIS